MIPNDLQLDEVSSETFYVDESIGRNETWSYQSLGKFRWRYSLCEKFDTGNNGEQWRLDVRENGRDDEKREKKKGTIDLNISYNVQYGGWHDIQLNNIKDSISK